MTRRHLSVGELVRHVHTGSVYCVIGEVRRSYKIREVFSGQTGALSHAAVEHICPDAWERVVLVPRTPEASSVVLVPGAPAASKGQPVPLTKNERRLVLRALELAERDRRELAVSWRECADDAAEEAEATADANAFAGLARKLRKS